MKKILICLYYYSPYISGLTIYAKNLAAGLVNKGYDVTIFCSQHEKTLPLREEISGVKIIREPILGNLGKGVIMPLFFIKTALMSKDYDVINMHLPNADLGLSSLFIPKKKIFITYHCDINLGTGFINKLIEKFSFLLMKIAVKKSFLIIGNSKKYFENSYFKNYLNKFTPIYPPINFSGINSGQDIVNISDDNTIYKIGFLGRIVYEKGINFLLEAICDQRFNKINFQVYLGGDYKNIRGGSVKESLDKLVELNKDKIVFLGNINQSQLKDFYNKIDVLVLPSIDPLESFGMVQVESLFNNTPIIASNMPGVSEVIDITGYGKLVIPRSPKDLANQILYMFEKKEEYLEYRKNNIGKQKALQYFGFENTINAYSMLFNK